MDNRTLPSGVDSKAIYRRIGRLTWPIVLQNLLSAAVTSADVVMLNFVGQAHISAVSLAAQYASVLFMIFYGLGTGVTMLATQYYGKGDMRAVEVVEGIALRFSLGVAALFALGAAFFPTGMMRVFTHDAELVAIGAEYLRWISVAYLCWGVIEIYLATLRSVGRVAVATALKAFAPKTDVAIELGGEDAKIIYFGQSIEQRMNGTCAGGTGAFIDQMAALLNTRSGRVLCFCRTNCCCGTFSKWPCPP